MQEGKSAGSGPMNVGLRPIYTQIHTRINELRVINVQVFKYFAVSLKKIPCIQQRTSESKIARVKEDENYLKLKLKFNIFYYIVFLYIMSFFSARNWIHPYLLVYVFPAPELASQEREREIGRIQNKCNEFKWL